MAKLRAVLLAAGRGVRMGGEDPKALIRVEDRSLAGYTIHGLKREGIDDLLVVTGHRHDRLVEAVTQEWGSEGLTLVRNARFASWGNFHSVRVAIDGSPGMDLLVVNSDIIITPEAYRRVVAGPGDLVIAVEKRYTTDEEDMRVHLDGDRVRGVSKHLKKAFSHGEFLGVSLIRPAAARAYLEVCQEAEWRSDTGLYYEDVYDRMIGRCDVRAALIDPGRYAEVDTPEDLPAAAAVARAHASEWA